MYKVALLAARGRVTLRVDLELVTCGFEACCHELSCANSALNSPSLSSCSDDQVNRP